MYSNFHVLAIVLLNCFAFLHAVQPQVDLPIGSLLGRERKTATGTTYYSYQGIPYGQPPVGALRFLAPVEKKPWKNVLDATHEKSVCLQMYSNRKDASEDCLHLHVYTPAAPSTNKSLPVMFFIYGGGYITGSASESFYGPEYLIDKDVIVVEHNYRVGSFGFFTTGDAVIPGNAGLKDQGLALRWTKKYIEHFGGDPNKITIFGQSAGSSSVSYHLLSPQSKGLFAGAILESGSALSPWAYNRNQKTFCHDMIKAINPDALVKYNSSSALLKYLQGFPAETINVASTKMYYPRYIQIQHGFYFTPVIEVEHPGAFLTEKQYEQFQKGHINNVPVMMGFTSEEQIGMLKDKYLNQNLKNMEEAREYLIPYDLKDKPEHRHEVAEIIHSRYSPNNTFIKNPRNFIRYMSDQSFTRSIHKQAELQSNYGHVWFYRFAYKGTIAGAVKTPVAGFSPDVGHGEELSYIFNNLYTKDVSRFPKSDILVHKRLVAMWTNFAKYQNPTPFKDTLLQNITWPLFKAADERYLDIGSDMEVKNHPNRDDFKFWDGIYNKYGTPPFDSY